jgi:ADP-heptose:LPS heptosyltransferase
MKKILIIKHGALGDVILSMYSVFTIWKHFKNCEISILTESKYKELFECLPFIKSIKLDNRPKFYYFLKYIKVFKWFYKSDFEWVFDLQTSKRTNLYFSIFSLFKDFNWNGIAKNCSHPHLNLKRKTLHTIERQKDQLRAAGITKLINPDWNYFKSRISKFTIKRPYAILVPGGSRHRKNKRWDFKNFLEIIKFLEKKNIISVLVGGRDEKDIFQNEQEYHSVINLIGKTNYSDLANLSSRAKLILGNDTGPMHLLVACSNEKIAKVVLFGGASDPTLCAPIGKNVMIVKENNIKDIMIEKVKNLINEKKL